MNDLREWLEQQGFRVYRNGLADDLNEAKWYACRKSALFARPCECNDDKVAQIVVYPYHSHIGGIERKSVEVEVRGQAAEDWWKLSAYGLRPEEFKERLPDIEARLIAAWNALEPIK